MENQSDSSGLWLSEEDFVTFDTNVIGFQLAPIQVQVTEDDIMFEPQA